MHKNPVKARFTIASGKSSVKLLDKAITLIFRFFLDKYKYMVINVGFWVVQNTKPVMDAINKLSKRRKATSISVFDVSTLYTKLPHNKLLIVLNIYKDCSFD